jgi:DNA end-binding protein Ku
VSLLSDEDFDSVKIESSSMMNIEKFVKADSIDPIYYASSYYLAPDGDAGHDIYAVLCKAIAETGRVALARVVIGQRERTIALRSMPGGLVAHTLDEQRDINDAKSILGDASEVKTDPDMIVLAKQLIDRQTTQYDPADLEDRYETRLRAMIDAKLKGEGIDVGEPAEPDRTNVVDLMAALKKSLGQETAVPKGASGARFREAKACRRCSGFQNRSEEGVGWRLIFRRPTFQEDQTTFLFQAYLAEELLVPGKVAKLEVAHAAFRALEMPVSVRHCGPHADRS